MNACKARGTIGMRWTTGLLPALLFSFLLAAFFAANPAEGALSLAPGSLDGAAYSQDGLTDKQLGLANWFAHMTLYNDGWEGWRSDTNQLGLDSYRYGLAFIGYAVGAIQAHTPAYPEYAGAMLDHIIQRMLRKEVWDFVETYWEEEPTFPDPAVWENIMYSGHLAQLIALYESITGDMKYEGEGFDFVWDEKTRIHYNGRKLMQVIYDQMESDERGGVPCEPDSIFVICQNHPHVAFSLYDAIHGSRFSRLDEKWRVWMEANAVIPDHVGDEHLKIVYHRGRGQWASAVSTPGADGWALSWMYPWIPDKSFVCEGYRKMLNNSQWKRNKIERSAHLPVDSMGKIFGVETEDATSFFPFLEAQCDPQTPRSEFVMNWFERTGRATDEDGDGVNESFHYETRPQAAAWVNANLALGMTVRGDDLARQYSVPAYPERLAHPYLESAGYPEALVKKAVYRPEENRLEIVAAPSGKKAEANFVVKNASPAAKVLIDGELCASCAPTARTIVIGGFQFDKDLAIVVENAGI